MSVYREEARAFSAGDRVSTHCAPTRAESGEPRTSNVQGIEQDGRLNLTMDGGRQLQLNPRLHPHLDHGYAVTSHSSQGQTAERVLVHVDTELAAKDLLNSAR